MNLVCKFGCHLAQFGSINSRKCKVLIVIGMMSLFLGIPNISQRAAGNQFFLRRFRRGKFAARLGIYV